MKSGLLILTAMGMAFVNLCLAGCERPDLPSSTDLPSTGLSSEVAQAGLNGQPTPSMDRKLVHLVWFAMKPDAPETDYTSLILELKKLAEIEVVQDLEVGRFQDLHDPRAMANRQIVMQMAFASQADYQTYQRHPIHMQLKSDIQPFMGSPPLTYDYWSE